MYVLKKHARKVLSSFELQLMIFQIILSEG